VDVVLTSGLLDGGQIGKAWQNGFVGVRKLGLEKMKLKC
jgi:hypothetical protein